MDQPDRHAPDIAPGMVLLLAIAAGLIVANLYYAQTLVGPIAQATGLSAASGRPDRHADPDRLHARPAVHRAAGRPAGKPPPDRQRPAVHRRRAAGGRLQHQRLGCSWPPRWRSASARSRRRCWCRSPRTCRRKPRAAIRSARWSAACCWGSCWRVRSPAWWPTTAAGTWCSAAPRC